MRKKHSPYNDSYHYDDNGNPVGRFPINREPDQRMLVIVEAINMGVKVTWKNSQ